MSFSHNITKHLPVQKTQYGGYLLLGLSCIFLFLLEVLFLLDINDVLAYQRISLKNYEYWRLLSAHLLHTNGWHLLLNVIGLLMLWLLYGDFANTRHLIIQSTVLAVSISICLYFFTPNLSAYVGLSGVLHGLFVIGAMFDIQHRRKTGYLLILGVIIKIANEQISPADTRLQNLIEASVAVDAHLYGAIFGAIIGAYLVYTHKQSKPYK